MSNSSCTRGRRVARAPLAGAGERKRYPGGVPLTESEIESSPMTDIELIRVATALAGEFRPARTCAAGDVAAAIRTRAGRVYTGICVDASCSLGFCAEHAAVAELAPCGRCRELMWQVSARNREARVILSPDRSVLLRELLPNHYQDFGA